MPLDADQRLRRTRLLEAAVVFSFGVAPHLLGAFGWLFVFGETEGGAPTSAGFEFEMLSHIVYSVGMIAAVLWIMRGAAESWADFGFRAPNVPVEIAVGVGLFLASYAAYYALSMGVYGLSWIVDPAWLDWGAHAGGFETGAIATPAGTLALPLILLLSLSNATAEQLVIVSYGLTRAVSLVGRRKVAAVVVIGLFSAYHAYQGAYGVVGAASFGVLCATYFLRYRRIGPCIVAHVLGDAVPYGLAYLGV